MKWVEKIKKRPQEEKVRIIWITLAITAVLLIALWVLTARYSKTLSRDTTLFDTIGKGINDIKNSYKH